MLPANALVLQPARIHQLAPLVFLFPRPVMHGRNITWTHKESSRVGSAQDK